MRVVIGLASVALALSACASTAANQAPRQAVSAFTCCIGHDVNRIYHPGDLVTIHWIRDTSEAVAPSNPIPITLTAHLEGPFAGVVQAKIRGAHGNDQVRASPVQVTDRTIGAPVSRLRIPARAAPGLYNLTFRIAQSGGSLSGQSLIHVTAS
jgi:hypothetical protein